MACDAPAAGSGAVSGHPLVRRWTRPARVRGALDDIALGLPLLLAAAAIVYRTNGTTAAIGLAVAGSLVLAGSAWWRSRRFGRGWLVRHLDAARGDIEDSADLLFVDATSLGTLQKLQRARVEARLADWPPVLRPAWSTGWLLSLWILSAVVLVVAVSWSRPSATLLAPSAEGVASTPGVPRLVGQRLRVVPPAYTGLPAQDLDTLDARAPQGSWLIWTLAFAPAPKAASLDFLDGRRIALLPETDAWRGQALLDRAALYRVMPIGVRQFPRLHRLDAVPDQPPSVVVRSPPHTLTIADAHPKRWPLLFEARDDYGVASTATLRITVASGDGEQVTFREDSLTLRGTGFPRHRRFAASLDLAALGFAGPGDLVAELTIADNAPTPHMVHAPAQILRWLPARPAQMAGLDGAIRATLPAYLRSQRQVINDAEDLLAHRRALPANRFAARSQSIGGDQHALRLHYGEFLGQENEGHENEMPTADAAASPVLGHEEDVLADYGHKHDDSESATLFDPETKARLTGAVEQMWQSELALNQGDPARALPFANRALVLIKQVQQATRVFIARVGAPELPPIDESRRLTGKRDGLGPDDLALPALAGDQGTAARVWASVTTAQGLRGLDEVARWSRSSAAHGGDPLALAAAIDAVQREPACMMCRNRLRALVWQALQRPTPGVGRRAAGDRAGARYLDAIGAGR